MTDTVCYFIQSHRDPEQIYRLIRTLRRGSPGGRIVVQHNPAAFELDWSPVAELPDTYLLPACGAQIRGSFSCQVQPYLDLVDWLEREGISYDWLVNLSAQDYPVTPVPAIEAFLSGATCDGYIRYWDVRSSASPWSRRKARARYEYRYRRLSPAAEPVLHALRPLTRLLPLHFYLDYGPFLGVRALRTPFHPGFRCYGGWAWGSLRRRAVLYLRDFLAANPEVDRHYRATMVPEESLVPTVLANSGSFDLVDDDLRYIDYSKAHKGSPRILTVADLPLLATGRYHFARKFDLGVDGEVLDRIDRELLGMEPVGS
jgi:Core-2/I-Branching enzyme